MLRHVLIAALPIATLLSPVRAEAQGSPRAIPLVNIEKGTLEIATPLPFDVPFHLRVPLVATVDSVRLTIAEAGGVTPVHVARMVTTSSFFAAHAVFRVPRLEPNRRFDIRVELCGSDTTGSGTPHSWCAAGKTMTSGGKAYTDIIAVVASTTAGWSTHFDTDVGVFRSAEAEYWGAAYNMNVYARPINKNEVLDRTGTTNQLFKRTSLTVGLSLFEFRSGAVVQPFWTVGSPKVGLSLRVLGPMRIGAGFVFFRQEDPNPLVTRTTSRRDGFLSLDADIEVRSVLGPLAAIFGSS